MLKQPKTSRYQLVASMNPDELLSEGYASFEDFYDPVEEERKKEVALDEQQTQKNTKSEEYYDKYYAEF